MTTQHRTLRFYSFVATAAAIALAMISLNGIPITHATAPPVSAAPAVSGTSSVAPAPSIRIAATAEPIPGEIAPDFEFMDSEGNARRLSEFRGKPVILDFWASWCSPCVKEFPTLRAIAVENLVKGLVVLSISIDGKQKNARAAAAKHKVAWAHGWMPGEWRSDGARKFKVAALPSTWFIGADGKILDTGLRGKEARAAARLLADGKLTVATDRMVKVSGLVVDEDGKPISGAHVGIDVDTVDTCAGADTFDEDWIFRTDANGVWTCPRFPKNAKQIGMDVYHPEYSELSMERGFRNRSGNFVTFADDAEKKAFMEGKHKIVLKRGVPIRGVVCDEAGKPIPNAWVTRKELNRTLTRSRFVKTNEKGEFLLTGEKETQEIITVSADGFAPDYETFWILENKDFLPMSTSRKILQKSASGNLLRFSLKTGVTIRGVVVDTEGNPIEGVWILASTEGENRTPSYSEHYKARIKPTDRQGRFELRDMNNPPFRVCFVRRDLTDQDDVRLRVGEERKIVLFGKTKIRVKIVDAETEKPVTDFRLRVHRSSSSADDNDEEHLSYSNFGRNLFQKDMGKGTFQYHFLGSISKLYESGLTHEESASAYAASLMSRDDSLGFEIFAPGFETTRVDFTIDGKTHELLVRLHKAKKPQPSP